MYTIIVNIYKSNQFKWQEQVLLNASTKAEVKQKAVVFAYFYTLDARPDPRHDLRTTKHCNTKK